MLTQATNTGKQDALLEIIQNCADNILDYNFRSNAENYHIFSDNFIKGIPIINEYLYYFIEIINEALAVQLYFLNNEIFIRGCITRGFYYRSNNLVFGEAIVTAYEAESTQAIYPRVIIHKNCIQNVNNDCNYNQLFLHDELLIQDAEGIIFVNYLKRFIDFHCVAQLLKHKKIILREIVRNETNLKVRIKYEWLAEYHNYVCSKLDNQKLIIDGYMAGDFEYLYFNSLLKN